MKPSNRLLKSTALICSLLLVASLEACTVIRPIVCPKPPAELMVPVPQSVIDAITDLSYGPPETRSSDTTR